MTKEVTMTIRLEPDLRTNFSEAAEMEHRPAAQVLRDFMRDYIEKVRARRTSANPPISAVERLRREEAMNYARASVALEGFGVPDEYEAEAQKFVRGEIDFDALTVKVHEIGQKR